MATPTKPCRGCNLVLPRERFTTRSNGQSESRCVECMPAYNAAKSKRSAQRHPEHDARRRANNRRATLRRYHGITVADYDRIFAAQNGVCAICGSPATQRKRKNLDVDHCHDTNVIRGLLCANCNRAIGLLDDRVEILERAIIYLRGPHWTDIRRVQSTRMPMKPRSTARAA